MIIKNVPFFIAEISANHCGNFKLAKKLIKCAKKSGADFVKFQTSIPELHISKFAKKANYQIQNTKRKETQLDMAKKISLSFNEFVKIKKYHLI